MNRGIRVLQTHALPLGYVTVWKKEQAIAPFSFGAGDEARTRYLDLGKVALYQMSYARTTLVIIRHRRAVVKPFFCSCRFFSPLRSS